MSTNQVHERLMKAWRNDTRLRIAECRQNIRFATAITDSNQRLLKLHQAALDQSYRTQPARIVSSASRSRASGRTALRKTSLQGGKGALQRPKST
jgi:hypothetical protein